MPRLTLASDADGGAEGLTTDRSAPVECPACSDRFGFPVIARVTIMPTTARRLNGGPLVLHEVRHICADCWKLRGVITPLI